MENIIRTEKIFAYMKENNLTKNEFCKKCHISTRTLNKLLAGEDIRIKPFLKIISEMKIYADDLFDKDCLQKTILKNCKKV